MLPTESISLGQLLEAEPSEHEQQLGAVVHAVGGEVDNGAAERFLPRRIVEGVEKGLVEPLLVQQLTGEPTKLCGGGFVTLSKLRDRLIRDGAGAHAGTLHQVCPALDVPDEVLERPPDGSVPDLELLVELRVFERSSAIKQLARRPRIVSQEPIEQVHCVLP